MSLKSIPDITDAEAAVMLRVARDVHAERNSKGLNIRSRGEVTSIECAYRCIQTGGDLVRIKFDFGPAGSCYDPVVTWSVVEEPVTADISLLKTKA